LSSQSLWPGHSIRGNGEPRGPFDLVSRKNRPPNARPALCESKCRRPPTPEKSAPLRERSSSSASRKIGPRTIDRVPSTGLVDLRRTVQNAARGQLEFPDLQPGQRPPYAGRLRRPSGRMAASHLGHHAHAAPHGRAVHDHAGRPPPQSRRGGAEHLSLRPDRATPRLAGDEVSRKGAGSAPRGLQSRGLRAHEREDGHLSRQPGRFGAGRFGAAGRRGCRPHRVEWRTLTRRVSPHGSVQGCRFLCVSATGPIRACRRRSQRPGGYRKQDSPTQLGDRFGTPVLPTLLECPQPIIGRHGGLPPCGRGSTRARRSPRPSRRREAA